MNVLSGLRLLVRHSNAPQTAKSITGPPSLAFQEWSGRGLVAPPHVQHHRAAVALGPKVNSLHRAMQPAALHVLGGPGRDHFDQVLDAGLFVISLFGQQFSHIDFAVDTLDRFIDVERIFLGNLDIIPMREVCGCPDMNALKSYARTRSNAPRYANIFPVMSKSAEVSSLRITHGHHTFSGEGRRMRSPLGTGISSRFSERSRSILSVAIRGPGGR